jgi:hypothetical protein
MKKQLTRANIFVPYLQVGVLGVLYVLSWQSDHFNPDLVVPSYRLYLGSPSPSVPAQAVLSWLPCSGCSFLAIPSRLSYPASSVLSVQPYRSYPVNSCLSVLYWLSFPSVLPRLSYPDSPVQAGLPRLPFMWSCGFAKLFLLKLSHLQIWVKESQLKSTAAYLKRIFSGRNTTTSLFGYTPEAVFLTGNQYFSTFSQKTYMY